MNTIIVPVDGASNIKLEVLDFETLATLHSVTRETPVTERNGLNYNETGTECDWFDDMIADLPECYRSASVIAPVARGASGGLVGEDNTLCEVPGERLTLAYTQEYPDSVEDTFISLAGSDSEFFMETGSIRSFPGSLTLIKRLLYEEMERQELCARSAGFATYGALLAGHFLGDDYVTATRACGNEHSYWMCHTGARNISATPGTPSTISGRIPSFGRLVPNQPSVAYRAVGKVPPDMRVRLGLKGETIRVVPGGHDTCMSHIPVMATFYHSHPEMHGTPVIHVDAGSWTMVAQIGGEAILPHDGYKHDIIVQGTVDGQPVMTARYGGGNDFKHVRGLLGDRGMSFPGSFNEVRLLEVLTTSDTFVLPNISPVNRGTGPFPGCRGRIVNEEAFYADAETAFLVLNLATAIMTSVQIEAVARDRDLPVVITAGAAKDPCFGRLLATITGKHVYGMFDMDGTPVSETTTLGSAITGKAACLSCHPYRVDTGSLGVTYNKLMPFSEVTREALMTYHARFLALVQGN